jgi:hypothetical protein
MEIRAQKFEIILYWNALCLDRTYNSFVLGTNRKGTKLFAISKNSKGFWFITWDKSESSKVPWIHKKVYPISKRKAWNIFNRKVI